MIGRKTFSGVGPARKQAIAADRKIPDVPGYTRNAAGMTGAEEKFALASVATVQRPVRLGFDAGERAREKSGVGQTGEGLDGADFPAQFSRRQKSA